MLEGPGLGFKFAFNIWFSLLTTISLHWFILNVVYIFNKHGPSIHTHPPTPPHHGARSKSFLEGHGLRFKFAFNGWFSLLTTLLLHWFLSNVLYIISKHGPSIHTHPYTRPNPGARSRSFLESPWHGFKFAFNVLFSLLYTLLLHVFPLNVVYIFGKHGPSTHTHTHTHPYTAPQPGARSRSFLKGPGHGFKFAFNVWFSLLTTHLFYWFLSNVVYILSKHSLSIHTHSYKVIFGGYWT
jgi:hypothetical protein